MTESAGLGNDGSAGVSPLFLVLGVLVVETVPDGGGVGSENLFFSDELLFKLVGLRRGDTFDAFGDSSVFVTVAGIEEWVTSCCLGFGPVVPKAWKRKSSGVNLDL